MGESLAGALNYTHFIGSRKLLPLGSKDKICDAETRKTAIIRLKYEIKSSRGGLHSYLVLMLEDMCVAIAVFTCKVPVFSGAEKKSAIILFQARVYNLQMKS